MMKTYTYPNRNKWPTLTQRPQLPVQNLQALVAEIFDAIKAAGDNAVKKYSEQFDGPLKSDLKVSIEEIDAAAQEVEPALKEAIQFAIDNVRKFHRSQVETMLKIETTPGVICWRESRPIDTVGLYIPGGSAPLFSTVIMLGVPAGIAGCANIVLCTPPNKQGNINPVILYTASLLGITTIYKVGGVQAVAAMALGTQTIAKCFKIFGPGNQYVTAAKSFAQQLGVAIDMPAGPSEVLVMANETAHPAWVAADLLSQAEHGADSQAMLVSTSQMLIEQTLACVAEQLAQLPRAAIATEAMKNSRAILMHSQLECIEFSNLYAPEHLIIAIENAHDLVGKITTAGSVFLGNYSCESLGDYASGTNHTLPTNGYAKNYSGVSVDSFVKKITFQQVSEQGLNTIGPAVATMAMAEGLQAHANAVQLRLNAEIND